MSPWTPFDLLSSAVIELCVLVEVIFNDRVALAGPVLQPRNIQNPDHTPGVIDETFIFQCSRRSRDRGAGTSNHVCKKNLGHVESVPAHPVCCDEQPPCESLLQMVLRIAACRLHSLQKLGLHVAMRKVLETVAA